MRKRIMFSLMLALMMVMIFTTSASAWYGSLKYATIQDVHLTDTYWWAREMGFNDSAAKEISKADDSVDMGLKFFDKTWHLDRSKFTGDKIDTRLKHADEEMEKAKYYISQVPGSGYWRAQYLIKEAEEHLGYGLHAMQDYNAHMDTGVGKKIPWDQPYSHGMEGVMVQAREIDGAVSQRAVEYLYDDVLWDYTPAEGWHKHKTKEESTRWQNTKQATEAYLYQFLLYGYGPGK